MKAFACGDVVPGCVARWSCTTDDEILALVSEHARVDHGLSELPDGLVARVRDRIVTVS